MDCDRRGVIDVGTNSVKLLVAEVTDQGIQPIFESSHQTRLGQAFYQTRRLQPGPISKTAEAVANFVTKAQSMGVGSIKVIATSAAREAVNAEDLTTAIRQAAGLSVQIISGTEEADWAFRGVTTDPALAEETLLLLDAGGGSTEFILGRGEHHLFCESFPLGTVRLLESVPRSDPPRDEELASCRDWLETFFREKVGPKLGPVLSSERRSLSGSRTVQLFGTGGTASILGCMEARLDTFDRQRIEQTRLSRARLRWHVHQLWSMPLEERKKIVGLPPNRADVILTGAAIYEAVMTHFDFDELRISTRGLRFAALKEAS
jgi:exopolyphosphatase/guanosine-5'-triphosphate,3'-diphosphate pyrophosphatase